MSLGMALLYFYILGFVVNTIRICTNWGKDHDIIDVLLGPFDIIIDVIKAIIKAIQKRLH